MICAFVVRIWHYYRFSHNVAHISIYDVFAAYIKAHVSSGWDHFFYSSVMLLRGGVKSPTLDVVI